MIDLILLAAGKGTRTKLDYPKQFLRVAGKPILIHTLEVFRKISEIGTIYVSIHTSYGTGYISLLEDYSVDDVVLVSGGETRQESVANCLAHVKTDRVIIHEAARPFITESFIIELLNHKSDIVVPVLPIPFAVLTSKPIRSIPKSSLYNIQLPQIFNTEKLKSAHAQVNGPYDEDSMMVYENIPDSTIDMVLGLEENIKITTPLDIKLAEVIYRERLSDNNRG